MKPETHYIYGRSDNIKLLCLTYINIVKASVFKSTTIKISMLVVHNLNKTKTLAGEKIILARNGDRKIKKRSQHK